MEDFSQYEIWSRRLTKIYPAQGNQPPIIAVNGIDLRVKRGVHGFLGPNGAGKSSTINMLVGASHVSDGEAYIHGYLAGSVHAKESLGFLPQDPVLPEHMEARDYLVFMGRLSGVKEQDARVKALELLEYFDLIEASRQKIRKFSGGMKQKLGLVGTLMHNPSVIILDEPTANMDPVGREQLIKVIRAMSTRATVFVSSHILSEVEQMAEAVTIIHKGDIIASDTITRLKQKHSGSTLLLQTSDNSKVLNCIHELPAVASAWIGEDGLYVKPRNSTEISLLQELLPRLVLEIGVTLREFSQPTLSLQDIFFDLLHFQQNSGHTQAVG